MDLTQKYVQELFYYSNGLLYYKSQRSNVIVGKTVGFIVKRDRDNRRKLKIDGKSYFANRIIFLYHHGYLPTIVDHINKNPLDDRIENLRAATISENNTNINSRKGSTSKYLGVSWNSSLKLWIASIKSQGKRMHLGCFKSEIDAALTYNKNAVIHHKEFASLNIIQP